MAQSLQSENDSKKSDNSLDVRGSLRSAASICDDYESFMSVPMKLAVTGIKTQFPKVSNISTRTLYYWLFKSDIKKETLVFDARPEKEYNVSHIDGAQRVCPQASDVQETCDKIREFTKGGIVPKVVCYCSVGYRSSLYADKLTKALAKYEDKEQTQETKLDDVSVFNLEGSLFKWANEDRPMVDCTNQKTPFAHPFNGVWGKLLYRHLRQYELPEEKNAQQTPGI